MGANVAVSNLDGANGFQKVQFTYFQDIDLVEVIYAGGTFQKNLKRSLAGSAAFNGSSSTQPWPLCQLALHSPPPPSESIPTSLRLSPSPSASLSASGATSR